VIPLLLLLALAAPKSPAPKRPPRAARTAAIAPELVPDAGPAADAASPLEKAGEVKEIPLDEKRARAVYRIRTAISIPAVVEFPEAFAAAPACGDCADASKPGASSALFALQAESNYLVIKPRLYPGAQADGTFIPATDFVTTVTVRLASLTLTLQVELTEDKRLADARVRFTLPNRAAESQYISDSITKAKSALEADFATRVEAAASERLLRDFLEPHECRSASARKRAEDMVLEVKELCRFGRHLYVRFALENRGRALFVLDSVGAGVGDGASYTALETRHLSTLPEVPFQQQAEGVVAFQLDDASDARAFELRVTEKGGRNRTVALQGFGF
jgi:hypothetical protein